MNATYVVTWKLTREQVGLTFRALTFMRTLLSGQLSLEKLPLVLRKQPELQAAKLTQALAEVNTLLFPADKPVGADKDIWPTLDSLWWLGKQFLFIRATRDTAFTTLQEPELRVVADALEAYSRFLAGQVYYLDWPIELRSRIIEQEHKLRHSFPKLGLLLYPTLSPGEQRGIQWDPDDEISREVVRSYELYKTLLKFDMNHRQVHNTHSGPVLHQSDWPLAKVYLVTDL
jgi:hypothetical protein